MTATTDTVWRSTGRNVVARETSDPHSATTARDWRRSEHARDHAREPVRTRNLPQCDGGNGVAAHAPGAARLARAQRQHASTAGLAP